MKVSRGPMINGDFGEQVETMLGHQADESNLARFSGCAS
jgi:hypothetical protein